MAYAPRFSISLSVTDALAQIERARGFLEGASLSKEWIALRQQRALVLEAHHTTHIEGTQLTLDQSERLLQGESVDAGADDIRELLNFRTAFELVSGYLESPAPITEVLIREIHRRLVDGVRGNSATPGEYRKVQNYVVNSVTQEVIYSPPGANFVPMLMAELIDWIRDTEIHPVLVAGIAQFQLVHIHPFLDGNGRTARLLSTLCLYQGGYDFQRLFTLSEFYDRDRPEYYKAIQSVRESDLDLTDWLEYFCHGLAEQLREAQDEATAATKYEAMDLSPRQRTALLLALEKDSFSLRDLEAACPKVSPRTLQRDLKPLIDKGLLEATGRGPSVRYHAV
jgi:cell filamentation protein, protein adenylyltransferase